MAKIIIISLSILISIFGGFVATERFYFKQKTQPMELVNQNINTNLSNESKESKEDQGSKDEKTNQQQSGQKTSQYMTPTEEPDQTTPTILSSFAPASTPIITPALTTTPLSSQVPTPTPTPTPTPIPLVTPSPSATPFVLMPTEISIQNQVCTLAESNLELTYKLDELLLNGNIDGRIFMNAYILDQEKRNYYSINPSAVMTITTSNHSNDKVLNGSGNTGPCGFYYAYQFYTTEKGIYTINYSTLNLFKSITITVE